MQKMPLWLGVLLGFLVGLGVGLVPFFVGGQKTNPSLAMFSPLHSTKATNWVAKVGEYVITQEDLEWGVLLFLEQVPANQRAQLMNSPELKAQLLEEFINQYVVVLEALKDKSFDTPDTRFLIQASVRQAVYQLYLRKRLPADTSVFLPTDAEINAFYEQNKAQLSKMNIPASQMKQFIQQELGNRKLQEWASRYVMQLREAYPIQRNTSASLPSPLNTLPLGK